jgi:UDP-sulfoquinovose synthase
MRVLIAGIDGYLGWPLSLHLADRGHEIFGIDNFSRRKNVAEVGSWSAIPIPNMARRLEYARNLLGHRIKFFRGDLRRYEDALQVLRESRPDAIVHLGEQPSAPYSMIDSKHAIFTQENNVTGTLNLLWAMKECCPDAHLVKLGTMGEYGTPNIEIPEGFLEIEYRGRKDRLPFPRQPGSYYHLSKVHDSGNIAFACKIWGLMSTDIMQGVVYGTRPNATEDLRLHTRFDFDESFGTVINRFCAQAVIGHPLTPYGKGEQRRGFIALVDSIQCLTIAVEHPPQPGEYRIFNQIDEIYGINELSELVAKAADSVGISVEIHSVENPRVESEEHFYKVDHERLKQLGFRPTRNINEELEIMIKDLAHFRHRISAKKNVIAPTTRWRGKSSRRTIEFPRLTSSPLDQPLVKVVSNR